MTIQPIETRYAGHVFRSRLEARWAVFFDSLQVPWEYEPQGYRVGPRQEPYLPDFFLPEHRLYVEIKPTDADRVDPDGVHRWNLFAGEVATEWENTMAAMFVGQVPDTATVDCAGPPRAQQWYDPGIIIVGDWQYAWCACPSGRHFDVQFEGRGGRIFCGCPRSLSDRYHAGDHPRILEAYRAARSARFEHGARGAAA